jgi:signal transduction histidine kinase
MIAMNTLDTHTMPTVKLDSEPRPRRGLGAGLARGAKRVGKDLAYLVAVLALSIVAFVVWVTGLSLTLSLLVLVVGIFVWLGTVYAFRWTVAVDRALAGWSRGSPIRGVYRRPAAPGLFARLRSVTADPQTWKDLGWLVGDSVVGFVVATVALTATALVIGYITMPAWWWAIPDPHQQYVSMNLGIYTVHSAGTAWLTTAIGLALAPLALLLNRGIVAAHSALAARILGPSEAQALRGRVDELASTRSGAVEAAQEQLERIERDLHDGAQARIVALAMELGMAEEELANDPEAAQRTVRRARDEALAALGELRDLSRGIRPAMLSERGLEAAIDALASRSAVPTTVRLSGDVDDAPEVAQTAAYFVVAEALTNAAKHAGANRARVSLERTAEGLTVAVEDDGSGGARADGSGLDGLRKRVRALDGRFEVASPAGGPTVISAEIPCG